MIAGIALLLFALVARTATINRYVRSRLLISALLFAAYAVAAALVTFGRLPAAVATQIQTTSPLLLAFGLANAIVVGAINPWRLDRIPERFPNIVQDTIVIALFAVAALLFLPEKVVATTAVGAVVIGFALQDTLGNLFAGLAIQIEKPFRVGHWVTIGGKDGLVSEITWRATKIRTKAGNFVVVPNSVLSRDTITNYSEPTRETQLEIQVRAGYDVAPNDVKAVIVKALEGEALMVSEHPPEVLLGDFADSWMTYGIRVWTTDFAADDRVRDHVRSRVYYAFQRHGISFPHPVQIQAAPQRHIAAPADDQATALDDVEILMALSPEQRGQLAAMSRQLLYGAGEVIAREGDAGTSMFVVRRGEAMVTLAGAAGELARLDNGSFFGEMSLLTGDRRSATVTAVTDCALIEIGVDAFRLVVLSDPASVERVASAVSNRREELERHRTARAATAAEAEARQTFLERVRRFIRSGASP
ncbi:MAG TPA: mechanosensitive ion channel family protein [Vicinamibacterales bacterium]|nr:mechanosensitive ion channel family protein [Vicinamibacterales bacterium]